MVFPADANLTTLTLFMRDLLNATSLSMPASSDSTSTLPSTVFGDDLEKCYRCALAGEDKGGPTTEDEGGVDDVVVVGTGEVEKKRPCNKKICRRRFYGLVRPTPIQQPVETCLTAANKYENDLNQKIQLRKLCWETMFGQELVKLTVMDTVFTLLGIFIGDFFRAVFLRVMNPCWFWDMEQGFPKYPDFKVAENILHLVNNQGMIWMGLFMAPALPALNLVKLAIIMYARSWAVMTTNVPHDTVFRASRSNNFYFILLLIMLFLCTLPIAYAIVQLKPSWHCGPFSDFSRMYHSLTKKIFALLPDVLHPVVDYCTSPGVVIPVFVLLVLVIYYLVSLTGLLRESNEDLKNQLHHERTEERRKLLQKKQGGGAEGSISDRWKKLLGSAMNSTRPSTGGFGEVNGGFSERAIDVPGVPATSQAQKERKAAAMLIRIIKARREKKKAAEEAKKAEDEKQAKEGAGNGGKKFVGEVIAVRGENGGKAHPSNGGVAASDAVAAADSVGSFHVENENGDAVGTSREEGNEAGGGETAPQTPAGQGGSMCNRFTLGTESSSLQSNDQPAEEDVTDEDEQEGKETVHALDADEDEGSKDYIRPPKIWISKSASMEHDLD